jgi:S1-C subfamily serine protease
MQLPQTSERCATEDYRVMVLSVPLGPALAGGGVFDLDGNLHGVVSRCGEGYAVLPREEVARALRLRGSSDSAGGRSLGLEVAALDPLAQRYFAADSGVLITGVELGGRAAGAGLRPGDVILAADSQVIRTPGDLATLAAPSPGSGPTFTLFRAGRVHRVPVPEAKPADSTLGLAFSAVGAGLELASVVPGSLAEHAGLRSGDRIVRVNAVEHPTVAQVYRALGGTDTGPVYLVYRRQDLERGVFLRP